MVYDVTDNNSFLNITEWLQEISDKASPGVLTMLIGNKCDCADRAVDYNRARKFAESHNLPFLEASAKHNVNVDRIFFDIVDKIKASGLCEIDDRIKRFDSTVVLKEGTEIKKNKCCR